MALDKEFRMYVRAELADIKKDGKERGDKIMARLREVEDAVLVMQVENRLKIGFYGFIGGLIPSLSAVVFFWIKLNQ